jgi:hypothetical protein
MCSWTSCGGGGGGGHSCARRLLLYCNSAKGFSRWSLRGGKQQQVRRKQGAQACLGASDMHSRSACRVQHAPAAERTTCACALRACEDGLALRACDKRLKRFRRRRARAARMREYCPHRQLAAPARGSTQEARRRREGCELVVLAPRSAQLAGAGKVLFQHIQRSSAGGTRAESAAVTHTTSKPWAVKGRSAVFTHTHTLVYVLSQPPSQRGREAAAMWEVGVM